MPTVVSVLSQGNRVMSTVVSVLSRGNRVMSTVVSVLSWGNRFMSTVMFPRHRVAKTMPHDPCVHTCISSASILLCSFPATCKRGACDCKLPSLAQSYADPSRCQHSERPWYARRSSTRQRPRTKLACPHPCSLVHATKVDWHFIQLPVSPKAVISSNRLN